MRVEIRVTAGARAFEGEALLNEVRPKAAQRSMAGKRSDKAAATKPSEALERLYRRMFFASPRTLGETMSELSKGGYNFNPPSVLMALKGKECLQRRGSKGSYRFVQRYPPS
jgi:hypothetical protein